MTTSKFNQNKNFIQVLHNFDNFLYHVTFYNFSIDPIYQDCIIIINDETTGERIVSSIPLTQSSNSINKLKREWIQTCFIVSSVSFVSTITRKLSVQTNFHLLRHKRKDSTTKYYVI